MENERLRQIYLESEEFTQNKIAALAILQFTTSVQR